MCGTVKKITRVLRRNAGPSSVTNRRRERLRSAGAADRVISFSGAYLQQRTEQIQNPYQFQDLQGGMESCDTDKQKMTGMMSDEWLSGSAVCILPEGRASVPERKRGKDPQVNNSCLSECSIPSPVIDQG